MKRGKKPDTRTKTAGKKEERRKEANSNRDEPSIATLRREARSSKSKSARSQHRSKEEREEGRKVDGYDQEGG